MCFYFFLALCIIFPPSCNATFAAAAATITEFHKVKEVEKRFGKGLKGIESIKNVIIKIAEKTQELVKTVETKKRELERIRGQLGQAKMNWDITKGYFSRFRGSVKTLYRQCAKYFRQSAP